MKKYQIHYFFSLLYSLFIFTNVQAIETTPLPETVRLLASQCAQCHGTTGNSLGDFDSIAGENFNELLGELLEMKADNDNDIMHKQIKGYSNEQIWFIADYYANSPEIPNEDRKDKDDEEKDEDEDEDEDEDDDDDDEEE